MFYFDEWGVRFEAMKTIYNPEREKTVFVDCMDLNKEIGLRKKQVPQMPITEF